MTVFELDSWGVILRPRSNLEILRTKQSRNRIWTFTRVQICWWKWYGPEGSGWEWYDMGWICLSRVKAFISLLVFLVPIRGGLLDWLSTITAFRPPNYRGKRVSCRGHVPSFSVKYMALSLSLSLCYPLEGRRRANENTGHHFLISSLPTCHFCLQVPLLSP
jgi:hypothetical protein